MGRKSDDLEPETFRDAFEMGQVGRWLRNQLIWLGGAFVLIGVAFLVLHFFPGLLPKEKADVAAATVRAQTLWKRGDQAGAIAYYRPIAAEGAAEAEFAMGTLYNNASGRLHDEHEAADWFQKAADQHFAPAERELARLYRYGNGVTKNDAVSLKLMRAAASAGDGEAQTDLAIAYDDGVLGLPHDPTQAQAWYGRAASKGGIVAQVNLSNLLFKGAAGPRDAPAAYRWASVAAAQSQPGTEGYRVAASIAAEARATMTPDEIAKADAWVKGWKATL